jgi:hypothetical protein
MGGPAVGGTMVTGTVTVNKAMIAGAIGSGYQGFSVEKTHLTNASFTGTNANMIGLYKLIGPVNLRIGANDVERCTWTAATPFANGGQPSGQPFGHTIGSVMVDGLNDFLTASGAKVIYGLNFSLNSPPNDAMEAAYAFPKLGANLYGFEIGNELNKYGGWPGAQKAQWESLATAVLGAAPNALLVGAAATAGGGVSLSTQFAHDEPLKFPGKIALLTQHYYLGPAGSGGVVTMQTIKSDIPMVAATLNTAATTAKIPNGWRFGEVNSFFNHGQAGLSDSLIEALWAIDVEFTAGLNGGTGVNFHGGETGQDGTNPFHYQPIVELNGVVTGTQPAYDAMLAVYLAGQGNLLATTVTTTNQTFTAYALDYKADGSTMVMLNNKSSTDGVAVTVDLGAAVTSASAIYLQGGTPSSLTAPASAVTLAEAGVTAQGTWARKPPYIQKTMGNTVSVFVPPASAALVRVQ